ncbi:MAG TPA: hypothetical protein VEU47_14285, partial [Candidatus Cybelea sp.]|nr:hypothetical protein [Candidatus Cybelea sp.]
MVENRPWVTDFAHAVLLLGVFIIAFPIYIAVIASTHSLTTMLQSGVPLLPGGQFLANYREVIFSGVGAASSPPVS